MGAWALLGIYLILGYVVAVSVRHTRETEGRPRTLPLVWAIIFVAWGVVVPVGLYIHARDAEKRRDLAHPAFRRPEKEKTCDT